MRLIIDDKINIEDIKVEDIPKNMNMYGFIGKTIEKLLHVGEYVTIQFTDGTLGHITSSKHYGRDIYRKHLDNGELNIHGFNYDDSGVIRQ